ncbi:glutathione S-transferase 1 [Hyalella azteca]|uniref:Glutathione S-transferase 1 n=1 Tax=Hyalella azteca TaxID=294128 RepID=A0A8B7NJI1_HYAAZ|nr:glutathione S-transferase 1 [Hyalella azteca]
MAPVLYYAPASPPCRSVMLVAKEVGLELQLKPVDVMKGEHMRPEFLAINPQHTIPTLVDDDLTLWESRAIVQYIANTYDKKGLIYPKEAKLRSKIDRLLYFDFGSLYKAFADFAFPVLREGEKPDSGKLAKIYDALALLETFLEGHLFAVGNRITIADHVLVATVSTLDAAGIDITKYRNVQNWYQRCSGQMRGYEEVNGKYLPDIGKMMKPKLRV